MEKKLEVLSVCVSRLEEVRKSINRTDQMEPADVLANKLNTFAGSLGPLFEAGRDMDQCSLLDVPLDMLTFLDGEMSNPEHYKYEAIRDAESHALKLQNRVEHLQRIHQSIAAKK